MIDVYVSDENLYRLYKLDLNEEMPARTWQCLVETLRAQEFVYKLAEDGRGRLPYVQVVPWPANIDPDRLDQQVIAAMQTVLPHLQLAG